MKIHEFHAEFDSSAFKQIDPTVTFALLELEQGEFVFET